MFPPRQIQFLQHHTPSSLDGIIEFITFKVKYGDQSFQKAESWDMVTWTSFEEYQDFF